MRIELYVDGSAPDNGKGGTRIGCGVVALTQGRTREFKSGRITADATNNLAELEAILLGLEKIKPEYRPRSHVLVFSDSEWAVKSVQGHFKNRVHVGLIGQVKKLLGEFQQAEINWTRGHVGHEYNERAHQLANQAAREAVPASAEGTVA